MISEDDLNSKEIQDDFNRLLNKAVQAGKSLEEYLQGVSLNSEEKEAILEYQKKREENKTGEFKQVIESTNFVARVTKTVKNNKIKVHVCVDQIDPINKRFKNLAYIFLRNGNLREDLDWREGKNYDRVSWNSFLSEDDADNFINQLKQYLMKLEGRLKGEPTYGIEPNIKVNSAYSNAPVGTLKPYKLFKSPTGVIDAVKQGWSWPAFALTVVWAFVKGLNEIGAGILIGILFAAILSVDSIEIEILFKIAIIGIHIWLGVKGNELRENNLRKRGYEFVKANYAETPEGAIASFLKEQKRRQPIKAQNITPIENAPAWRLLPSWDRRINFNREGMAHVSL